jgi:hypothetical protein
MLNVLVTNGEMSNNRTRSPSCRIHLPALGSTRTLKETPAAAPADCHTIQRMSGPRVISVPYTLKLVCLGKNLCLMFWRPRFHIQPDNCELIPGSWCKCGWLLILDAAWFCIIHQCLSEIPNPVNSWTTAGRLWNWNLLSKHSSLVPWFVRSSVRPSVAYLITYFPQERGMW